ncbi:MAG: replicative DNA helicase [Hyphomicrobiales bacterium]|nr:replicative DNA helicase [Hyphomicrobiales bacterium]
MPSDGAFRGAAPLSPLLGEAREPPHNIQAEQALLGAILANTDALSRVEGLVEAAHFFEPLHGRIFEALARRVRAGETPTPITLKGAFEGETVGEGAGAISVAAYLGRLVAHATTVINARDYATAVKRCAVRRSLISLAHRMLEEAHGAEASDDPARQIENAERALFDLAEYGAVAGHECSIGDAALRAVDMVSRAFQRDGGLAGLSTGFRDLDRQLGGLQDTDLVIIAGRPGMGKSALAANIAFNVGVALRAEGAGGEVSFYSLEMSSEQLALRQIAHDAGVSIEGQRRGTITEAEMIRAMRAAEAMSDLPMHIDATGGLDIARLSARARRRKRIGDTRLIVVDYLQLMAGKGDNRVAQVTEITTGLKALAKELGVPVIALSQLSRGVESREDKRPLLSDLRESGSIEQDADVVMFVYRAEYYLEGRAPSTTNVEAHQKWQEQMGEVQGLAEVIIAKHRHGPTGSVAMAFDGRTARFADLAHGGHRGMGGMR